MPEARKVASSYQPVCLSVCMCLLTNLSVQYMHKPVSQSKSDFDVCVHVCVYPSVHLFGTCFSVRTFQIFQRLYIIAVSRDDDDAPQGQVVANMSSLSRHTHQGHLTGCIVGMSEYISVRDG